jgi:hypothetical protein
LTLPAHLGEPQLFIVTLGHVEAVAGRVKDQHSLMFDLEIFQGSHMLLHAFTCAHRGALLCLPS